MAPHPHVIPRWPWTHRTPARRTPRETRRALGIRGGAAHDARADLPASRRGVRGAREDVEDRFGRGEDDRGAARGSSRRRGRDPLSYVRCARSCVMGRAARRCGQMWVQGSPPPSATRHVHVNVGATARACHAAARASAVHHLPLSVVPKARIVHKRGASIPVDRPLLRQRIPVRPQLIQTRTGGAGSDRRTPVTCLPASPPARQPASPCITSTPAISDTHL